MNADSKPKIAGSARSGRVAIGVIVASTIMMVETIPARAASNDAQLLKDAQRVF